MEAKRDFSHRNYPSWKASSTQVKRMVAACRKKKLRIFSAHDGTPTIGSRTGSLENGGDWTTDELERLTIFKVEL